MSTAIPIIGGREVVLTSGVTESAYRNALGYSVLGAGGAAAGPDTLVFADDDAVAPGTRFGLGAFPAGSRLEFFILQDGGARLTGDEQALVTAASAGGGFAVSFEDLLADAALNPGGLARDGDFDDVVFSLGFGAGLPAGTTTVHAVFGADDGQHGIEPWISDGTAEGTRLLRDIVPGTGTSFPANFAALGGGRALFSANDGINGIEPWVTDGTAEGTRLLRDVNPVPVGSSPADFETLGGGSSSPRDFTALGGGRAVFVANDGVHGPESWVTDGTAEGTRLLLNINPGTRTVSSPGNFTALGDGRALFVADDGVHFREPWITDGTPEGTRLLRDTNPGGFSSPGPFTAFGDGRALFSADNGVNGSEPWITDGTAEGTRLLRDIASGPGGSLPGGFTALGDGRVVFAATATDPVNGRDLWITDGTAEGTRLLLDFAPGTGGGVSDLFIGLGGGRALFRADDGVYGSEPWVTDGTAGGTRLLRDIAPGTGGPGGSFPAAFAALGDGRVLFAAVDPVNGREPWVTDGTPEGTRLLLDIIPGWRGGFFDFPGFTALGDGRALFTADDGINGRELWITDGTAEGTHLVSDINPGAGGSSISTLPGRGPPSPIALLETGAPSGDHPFV